MNKNKDNNIELVTIAKLLIAVAAIVQLIFAEVHIAALLLMENEICGFLMFLFVLTGLIALFEATRINKEEMKDKLITICVCVLTSGIGYYLITIYRNAISIQRSIDVSIMNKAIVFCFGIIAMFLVSGMLDFIDIIKSKKK